MLCDQDNENCFNMLYGERKMSYESSWLVALNAQLLKQEVNKSNALTFSREKNYTGVSWLVRAHSTPNIKHCTLTKIIINLTFLSMQQQQVMISGS